MKSDIRKSVNWFKGLLTEAKRTGRARVYDLRGKLLLMSYDPRTKEKLPYYDVNPLIFVIEVRSNYILGLNVHYLDTSNRKKMVEAMFPYGDEDPFDQNQLRLDFRYHHIENFQYAGRARACLKKYYTSNIKNWLLIPTWEWNNIIYLPIYEFKKAPVRQVWQESKEKF